MTLEKVLQKFDRFLYVKRLIDGTFQIHRRSQFNKSESYVIKELTNQYIGSPMVLTRMLHLMDNRKIDFIVKSILNNKKIRDKKGDKRAHREVAEFISSGGNKIVA